MNKLLISHTGYEVKEATIVRTSKLTNQDKLFEIALPEGEMLDFEPGQFVEVSLRGVGEAPISICSSPTHRNSFELCVRIVGRLTRALHRLEAGDNVGIRGPFGVGFPITKLIDNDLLMVAGGIGIAPLRSLINYVMDNRRDFGKVQVLFGCKNPQNILFKDEIITWQQRLDVNFSCTVDEANPEWMGNVGVITTLIPNVDIDPEHTFAVIVGPPVMYRFVIAELLKKGIAEDRIVLSLERHMKCGLGKCGHCQIHDIYCCQDGPVFFYSRIKNLKGAI
ncbi:MAG TPA: oxidoreductase [Thermodesulforhabdus norvegica]|uniref:Oxidoreductase n=1 Tax=Thermodesulforhabdus norvegica TaxID=39841 RepID=A0A7C0WSA4_9BACT|nr:oxidoreductase [Thermodesulforhabdus norvegica]